MKGKTITAKRLNELIADIRDDWKSFVISELSVTPPAKAIIKDEDGDGRRTVTIDKSPAEAGEFIVSCECPDDDCFHMQVLWKLLLDGKKATGTERKIQDTANEVPIDADNPNLDTWRELSRPPKEALKRIAGGRLSGMSDINPQWRLQMMTAKFGPIGIGWYYEMLDRWVESGASSLVAKPQEVGEIMCFVSINLFVKIDGEWSKPIFGLGGSKLIEKEKDHYYNNDEGYKMALTDALSVAMKELGVAADIYMGLWDGSKYATNY